jgi:DNA modification methylase
MQFNRCIVGDCRSTMRALVEAGVRVQTVVTSPPYWGLRNYGVDGQLGLEPTPGEYIANMVEVFRLVRDLLADDGTLWLNMGDSYAGSPGGYQGKHGDRATRTFTARIGMEKSGGNLKPKDLVMMPHRLAIALQDDGWWVRSDIVWHKPNPMPESIYDRPTKAHEYVFLMAKSEIYFYDADGDQAARVRGHPRPLRARTIDDAQVGRWRRFNRVETPDHRAQLRSHAEKGPLRVEYRRRRSSGPGGALRQWGTPQRRGVGLRRPAGWEGSPPQRTLARGPAAHGRGVNPKAEGITREDGKANESFSAAVRDVVLMRNARSVWTIPTEPFSGAHFATFPTELVKPCILAGSRPGDLVFDPFMGSGTVAEVAMSLSRQWLGCELNPDYVTLQGERTRQHGMAF